MSAPYLGGGQRARDSDDCTLTKKNKHPTRDWNPAIVVSVWKYKPPRNAEHQANDEKRYWSSQRDWVFTTKYAQAGSHRDVSEEECFVSGDDQSIINPCGELDRLTFSKSSIPARI